MRLTSITKQETTIIIKLKQVVHARWRVIATEEILIVGLLSRKDRIVIVV